jgi:hypothetical protein
MLAANDGGHDCIMAGVRDSYFDMVHLLFQYIWKFLPVFIEPSNPINLATKFT